MADSRDLRVNDDDFGDRIFQLIHNNVEEESDVDVDDSDQDPDYVFSADSDTSAGSSLDGELQIEDEDEMHYIVENFVLPEGESEYFWGKDESVWRKKEENKQRRTPQHNILRGPLPGPTRTARNLGQAPGKIQVWESYFTAEILSEILVNTNKKLEAYRANLSEDTNKSQYKDTDILELRALLGLILLNSVTRSSNENVKSIFNKDITSRPVFRATMPSKRFEVLLVCLRFDDAQTREMRKRTDPAAPISDIFQQFINNCKSLFLPGPNVTVDEMLVPFRGRCPFRVYMPKKPKKYGIKIMCLTDSSSSYLVNAYIYKGKNSDSIGLSAEEQQLSKPTQSVIRLCKGIENTNRNVTGDNYFTSIECVDALGDRSLTYVGTMKKNKREIPPEFLPSKNRKVGSTLYGFAGNTTLLSVVPKKNNSVILVSSMHHSIETGDRKNKPEMVCYYNKTKAGVDLLDMKCAIYSSSRRTRRWPLAIFYQMLDISCINSFILYLSFRGNPLVTRYLFVQDLALELIKPHMTRRLEIPNLPRDIRATIQAYVGNEDPQNPGGCIPSDKLEKRKTCSKCPASKERKTNYKCIKCDQPICLECSRKVCTSCATKI